MGLTLHNSLTRTKAPFVPLNAGRAAIYICGPTVYSSAHIGNFRTFLLGDILRRFLVWSGLEVTYVSNITDVGHLTQDDIEAGEDKMQAAAEREGVTIWDIAGKYTAAYHEDCRHLNILPPDVEPKATEHIDDMITMISTLIDKGHAYVVDGEVYYDISSFPAYGQLSGNRLEDLKAGARVDVLDVKRHPGDFALWKKDDAHLMQWDSPWGRGFPGWHIECSAMIEETLGLPIDIHGGGIDLVFPHHENEIAQGVCAHGHAHEAAAHAEYSRYWMHNGFLTMDAEKMSKSLGNVLLLHDLVQSIPGEVVRWALLSAHYRQPLDWNQALLEQSRKSLDRLYGALHRAAAVESTTDAPPAEFLKAIEDDLNTPGAMAVLFSLSSEIERGMTAGDTAAVAAAKGQLVASAALLGVLQSDPAAWLEGDVPDDLRTEVEALLEQRAAARAAKDWPEADRIRDRLNALSVVVMDGPQGPTWRLKG